MAYQSSPRPHFNGPAAIPFEAATRHLWGDSVSGEVADWIYVSSDKIHQLVFGLAPRGSFRHSDAFRTIFAADELLYVLSGTMVLANPQTGEVHRVRPGEAAFFRRDTWHHAFNHSLQELRVLEFFAPPPSQGTSGAYALSKPNLLESRYAQDEWLARWPMAQEQARGTHTIKVLRESDVMWRLEGQTHPILVGLWASTEHLTVGQIELLPGEKSEVHWHGGDESLYVVEGSLYVHVPDNDAQRWFELKAGDGFYVPQGIPHQYHNITTAPTKFLFGVAPCYL